MAAHSRNRAGRPAPVSAGSRTRRRDRAARAGPGGSSVAAASGPRRSSAAATEQRSVSRRARRGADLVSISGLENGVSISTRSISTSEVTIAQHGREHAQRRRERRAPGQRPGREQGQGDRIVTSISQRLMVSPFQPLTVVAAPRLASARSSRPARGRTRAAGTCTPRARRPHRGDDLPRRSALGAKAHRARRYPRRRRRWRGWAATVPVTLRCSPTRLQPAERDPQAAGQPEHRAELLVDHPAGLGERDQHAVEQQHRGQRPEGQHDPAGVRPGPVGAL